MLMLTVDISFDTIWVMTKLQKLIDKILEGRDVSYEEAEKILLQLGFKVRVKGSHHVFFKDSYAKNVSIKRRVQLLAYQMRELKEVLRDHGY
jgi:predicted RNA binding protein YcfA (HicA-like mRNA interferase family)